MENAEFVSMPNRQVKNRHFEDEGDDIESPTIRMFSMENVAERVFHRKKKMVGEFDDEEIRRNDHRNKLAILKDDLKSGNARMAITGEDMEDWFLKLQIRTQQNQVAQVTPVATSKLAATNKVATAAVRLKGNVRIDKGEKIVPSVETHHSHRGQSQSHTRIEGIIAEELYGNIEEKNNAKEVSVRSKKLAKQSTEQKESTRRKNKSTHNFFPETASEIRKIHKTRPHDFPTAEGLVFDTTQKSKIKSNKNTHSSNKSTIGEEH